MKYEWQLYLVTDSLTAIIDVVDPECISDGSGRITISQNGRNIAASTPPSESSTPKVKRKRRWRRFGTSQPSTLVSKKPTVSQSYSTISRGQECKNPWFPDMRPTAGTFPTSGFQTSPGFGSHLGSGSSGSPPPTVGMTDTTSGQGTSKSMRPTVATIPITIPASECRQSVKCGVYDGKGTPTNVARNSSIIILRAVNLPERKTTTGVRGQNLVLLERFLEGGYRFKLNLHVSCSGREGSASIFFETLKNRGRGACSVSPKMGVELETVFQLSCTGWESAVSSLSELNIFIPVEPLRYIDLVFELSKEIIWHCNPETMEEPSFRSVKSFVCLLVQWSFCLYSNLGWKVSR